MNEEDDVYQSSRANSRENVFQVNRAASCILHTRRVILCVDAKTHHPEE